MVKHFTATEVINLGVAGDLAEHFNGKGGTVQFVKNGVPALFSVEDGKLFAHTHYVGPVALFDTAYNNYLVHGLVGVEVN
jgi:hypothetical protein